MYTNKLLEMHADKNHFYRPQALGFEVSTYCKLLFGKEFTSKLDVFSTLKTKASTLANILTTRSELYDVVAENLSSILDDYFESTKDVYGTIDDIMANSIEVSDHSEQFINGLDKLSGLTVTNEYGWPVPIVRTNQILHIGNSDVKVWFRASNTEDDHDGYDWILYEIDGKFFFCPYPMVITYDDIKPTSDIIIANCNQIVFNLDLLQPNSDTTITEMIDRIKQFMVDKQVEPIRPWTGFVIDDARIIIDTYKPEAIYEYTVDNVIKVLTHISNYLIFKKYNGIVSLFDCLRGVCVTSTINDMYSKVCALIAQDKMSISELSALCKDYFSSDKTEVSSAITELIEAFKNSGSVGVMDVIRQALNDVNKNTTQDEDFRMVLTDNANYAQQSYISTVFMSLVNTIVEIAQLAGLIIGHIWGIAITVVSTIASGIINAVNSRRQIDEHVTIDPNAKLSGFAPGYLQQVDFNYEGLPELAMLLDAVSEQYPMLVIDNKLATTAIESRYMLDKTKKLQTETHIYPAITTLGPKMINLLYGLKLHGDHDSEPISGKLWYCACVHVSDASEKLKRWGDFNVFKKEWDEALAETINLSSLQNLSQISDDDTRDTGLQASIILSAAALYINTILTAVESKLIAWEDVFYSVVIDDIIGKDPFDVFVCNDVMHGYDNGISSLFVGLYPLLNFYNHIAFNNGVNSLTNLDTSTHVKMHYSYFNWGSDKASIRGYNVPMFSWDGLTGNSEGVQGARSFSYLFKTLDVKIIVAGPENQETLKVVNYLNCLDHIFRRSAELNESNCLISYGTYDISNSYTVVPPKFKNDFWWCVGLSLAVAIGVTVAATVTVLKVKKVIRRRQRDRAMRLENLFGKAEDEQKKGDEQAKLGHKKAAKEHYKKSQEYAQEYDKLAWKNNILATFTGGTKYSRSGLWGDTDSSVGVISAINDKIQTLRSDVKATESDADTDISEIRSLLTGEVTPTI